MDFNEITKELLETFFIEIKKKKYSKILKTYILDPSAYYILDKCYPYIIITCIFLILMFLIIISMFYIVIRGNYSLKRY